MTDDDRKKLVDDVLYEFNKMPGHIPPRLKVADAMSDEAIVAYSNKVVPLPPDSPKRTVNEARKLIRERIKYYQDWIDDCANTKFDWD